MVLSSGGARPVTSERATQWTNVGFPGGGGSGRPARVAPMLRGPVMPRRERTRMLVRGLAKLLAVVVVAGVGGVGLGLAVSKLSGGSGPQLQVGPAVTATRGATTGPAGRAAAHPAPKLAPQARLAQVSVSVLSAVLQPATTPSGQQRRRARLSVRIRAQNGGKLLVIAPRPVLLAAGVRVPTDRHADAPGTRFGPLRGGATATVTLQFEIEGAVTTQLMTQRTARIVVAGRTLRVPVTIGPPV